jgi:hypothetical protein
MVWRIPTTPIIITNSITIRLSNDNYIYWRTQVVPILLTNLIYGFIDGTLLCPSETVPNTDKTVGAPPTIDNPLYSAWHQQDQAILSAIVSSLTEPVIGMVTLATTSQEPWETLEVSFASQSTARVMEIRAKLNKTRKLDSSADDFFNKIKGMANTQPWVSLSAQRSSMHTSLLGWTGIMTPSLIAFLHVHLQIRCLCVTSTRSS